MSGGGGEGSTRLHGWFQTRAAEVPCEVSGGEQSVEVRPRVQGTEAGPGFGADKLSAGQREVKGCVGTGGHSQGQPG